MTDGAKAGWTYLVGAGPGDPELLTRRAARLLATADRILVEPGVTEAVASLAPDERRSLWRGDVEAFLRDRDAESSVVVLAHGDALPSLTSLLEGMDRAVEVVCGVDPVAAAVAFAGLAPHRHALAHATGDWSKAIDGWRAEGHGDDAPVVVVTDASLPTQRTHATTLGRLAAVPAPVGAVAAIGAALDGRERRRWFDRWPLFGRRVVVTRPAHQIAATADDLRRRGAEPLAHPTIALRPPPDPPAVLRAIDRMDEVDLVVFTSPNGVDWFWRALDEAERDARAFRRAEVAAIGPATAAALRGRGVRADIVAPRFVAEELATAILDARGERRGRVLLPRALVAREVLPDTLREAGFEVEVVPVYETVPATGTEALVATLDEGVDALLFTSSSTVDNLVARLGEEAKPRLEGITIASIGPITTATAEGHGLTVSVTADVSTGPGLVDALEAHYAAGSA